MPRAEQTTYEGIPAMTVAEAIRDCRGLLIPERLVDAVTEAAQAGLIRKTAMKIRVGEAGSRYTPDFDASRSRNVTVDDYVEQLRDRLERGWSGFTGTVRVLEPRSGRPG